MCHCRDQAPLLGVRDIPTLIPLQRLSMPGVATGWRCVMCCMQTVDGEGIEL
jgi:hypothetical protein